MHDHKRPAPADAPIHDLISHRWSPRAFEARPVEREKLRSLFEAARWAASSYNAQPWYFIVGTKDDPENYKKVLDSFVEFNQSWAKNAPVVVLSVAAHKMPHDGSTNRHAFHDVGQAAANLALQATALGLQVHQMAGIVPEKAREIFSIPPDYEAVAGFAIGYPDAPESLPDHLREREKAPRSRKPVSSFVFTGNWGQTSKIVS
ncbi:MAG TPA: nitroreductase family protein [Candidatus Baltobacteraceae bacterium]|jgi:nitroreductase|nr:nitroreductase family protein [Candidatus Baltobacteraceae bacterium]